MVRYLPLNASSGLFNELMLLSLCSSGKGVQQQFLFTGRGCSPLQHCEDGAKYFEGLKNIGQLYS